MTAATIETTFLQELGVMAPPATPSAPPTPLVIDDNLSLWLEPQSDRHAENLTALIDEFLLTSKRIREGEKYINDLNQKKQPTPRTWQIRLNELLVQEARLRGQIAEQRVKVAEVAAKMSGRLREQWDWLVSAYPKESIPEGDPRLDPRFRDGVTECLLMDDAEFQELVRGEEWFAKHQPNIPDRPFLEAVIARASSIREDRKDDSLFGQREHLWLRELKRYGQLCDAIDAASDIEVPGFDIASENELVSWARAWKELATMGFEDKPSLERAIGGWDHDPREVIKRAREVKGKQNQPVPVITQTGLPMIAPASQF